MGESRITTRRLTEGAAIAAIYVVLTLIFQPISYGQVQVRVSEALTILPMFTPMAVPGLFVGCVLANMLGGYGVLDVVLGSLATLIGAVGSRLLRRNRWLVPIPPIVANMIIVPIVLKLAAEPAEESLVVLAVLIAAGEILSCGVLGELLATALMARKSIFHDKDVK